MLCLPSGTRAGVHHTFGVTRDPAAEMYGSPLFQHDVCTLSVSAHDETAEKVPVDLGEAVAGIAFLLGADAREALRVVPLVHGSSVTYFNALVDGDRFYAPSPFQDAFLARRFASQLTPAS